MYKEGRHKVYFWALFISIIITIAAGLSTEVCWKMWFILPFSIFFLYICGKSLFHTEHKPHCVACLCLDVLKESYKVSMWCNCSLSETLDQRTSSPL